jgi:hypothetical protein
MPTSRSEATTVAVDFSPRCPDKRPEDKRSCALGAAPTFSPGAFPRKIRKFHGMENVFSNRRTRTQGVAEAMAWKFRIVLGGWSNLIHPRHKGVGVWGDSRRREGVGGWGGSRRREGVGGWGGSGCREGVGGWEEGRLGLRLGLGLRRKPIWISIRALRISNELLTAGGYAAWRKIGYSAEREEATWPRNTYSSSKTKRTFWI